MKYIISESRLDNLIEKYLDTIYEPRELVRVPNWAGFYKLYWVVNGKVVADIDEKTVWIDKAPFFVLPSLFSLERKDAIKKTQNYFSKKLNASVYPYIGDLHGAQNNYDKWLENQ